jgi:hypothetical protein
VTLPPLYLEGLTQRALRGPEHLNLYKLGLIEAILKEGLRASGGDHSGTLRSAMQAALDVALWEAPRSQRPPPGE